MIILYYGNAAAIKLLELNFLAAEILGLAKIGLQKSAPKKSGLIRGLRILVYFWGFGIVDFSNDFKGLTLCS